MSRQAANESFARHAQARLGVTVDGWAGARTRAAFDAALPPEAPPSVPAKPADDMPRFPAITRTQIAGTFGPAGGPRSTAGRCVLPFPFPLAWDQSQRVSRFSCHDLLAEPMTAVFAAAARHYGEAAFRRLRLDQFGGCFNHRPVRGGSSLSIHSWGAAVDIDPLNNGLHTRAPAAWMSRPEYETWWRIVESSGAISFGKRHGRDWMHWSYVQE